MTKDNKDLKAAMEQLVFFDEITEGLTEKEIQSLSTLEKQQLIDRHYLKNWEKDANEYQKSLIEDKIIKWYKKPFVSAIISFLSFMLLLTQDFDKESLIRGSIISAVFVMVLFLHEIGHFLMQKKYAFSNTRMSFFGPFGAYVQGVSKNNYSKENFWIYIMGPLPGCLIGISLIFIPHQSFDLYLVGLFILLLNAFNLIPVGFLDGGRISDIVSNNHPRFLQIISRFLYIPLLIYIYQNFFTEYHNGDIRGIIFTGFFVVVFTKMFISNLKDKNQILVKKISLILSNYLLKRDGYISNKIDFDTTSYIFKEIPIDHRYILDDKFSFKIKIPNYGLMVGIWANRSIPLTKRNNKFYTLIYLSLLLISILTFYHTKNGLVSLNREYSFGKYEGTWRDLEKVKGTMTYENGGKYVGEWKGIFWHGQGTMTYANGVKYVGEWKENNREGKGTMTYENGEKYVGEWKDDNFHGQGTYTWAEEAKYVGEWKDSKKDGQGTMYWKNKSKMYNNIPAETTYVGQFLNDFMHGYGKGTYANGTVKEGLWKEGEFIR